MAIDVAIYEPPSDGLPYLVVTFGSDGVNVSTTNSRIEARKIASERTVEKKRARKRGTLDAAPAQPT
jgi:hypothetical protein